MFLFLFEFICIKHSILANVSIMRTLFHAFSTSDYWCDAVSDTCEYSAYFYIGICTICYYYVRNATIQWFPFFFFFFFFFAVIAHFFCSFSIEFIRNVRERSWSHTYSKSKTDYLNSNEWRKTIRITIENKHIRFSI